MIPIKTNLSALFLKLLEEFKKIVKVCAPKKVLHSILVGENLLSIMGELLGTLEREEGIRSREIEHVQDSKNQAVRDTSTQVDKKFVFIHELLKIALF